MDKLQAEARRIAIEAASKDPNGYDYTFEARQGKPWEPHTWVVNAITAALRKRTPVQVGAAVTDMITEIVDKANERLDRRITTIVDSVTERLRALEGTGDRTSSPARTSVVDVLNLVTDALKRITMLEVAPPNSRTDAEIDAIGLRCDALASRIEQLESGRTGPRAFTGSREILAVSDDPDRMAKGMADALVRGIAQRSPFPPGVADPTTEALRNAADLAQRLKTEQHEHRCTIDRLNAGASREMEMRDEIDKLKLELHDLRKERDDALASKARKRERLTEATLLIDRIAQAVGRGLDASTALGSREQNTTEILKWIEATKRTIADQAAQITELRGELVRVRTIVDEATFSLDAKAAIDGAMPLPMRIDAVLAQVADLTEQLRVADADRVPLRMDLDEAKADVARMLPVVLAAQSWASTRVADDRNAATLSGKLLTACDDYEEACAKAASAGLGDDEDDGFAMAAANEGARIAAESRAERESDPGAD